MTAIKVVTTEVVPAVPAEPERTVEVVAYKCPAPGCTFTCDDEEEVDLHYGREHSCKRRRVGNIREILYFATKDDMLSWERNGPEHENGDDCIHRWRGAGWYILEKTWNARYCTDEYTPMPAEDWARQQIALLQVQIEVCEDVIKICEEEL